MNDRQPDKQPNLLFIYADQHRADVLGCAGNDTVVTPHLDRLATEGVRFDQTWTESPICQPARASLLTGRYPNDHGVLGNFAGDCQPEWDTFPRRLQQADYTTASIGKTHFASWPMMVEPGTPAPTAEWIGSFGFDHVVEDGSGHQEALTSVHTAERRAFSSGVRFLNTVGFSRSARLTLIAGTFSASASNVSLPN